MAAPNYGPPHTIMTETSGPAPVVHISPPEVNITLTPTLKPEVVVNVAAALPVPPPKMDIYVYNIGSSHLPRPAVDSIVIVRASGDIQMVPVGPFLAPLSPFDDPAKANDHQVLSKAGVKTYIEEQVRVHVETYATIAVESQTARLEASTNATLVKWGAQLPRKEDITAVQNEVRRVEVVSTSNGSEIIQLTKQITDLTAEVNRLRQALKRKP